VESVSSARQAVAAPGGDLAAHRRSGEREMDPQDKLDRRMTLFWGDDLYFGTMRWLLWLAAFASAGGIAAWLVEHS
jgi:hypothetical protein